MRDPIYGAKDTFSMHCTIPCMHITLKATSVHGQPRHNGETHTHPYYQGWQVMRSDGR